MRILFTFLLLLVPGFVFSQNPYTYLTKKTFAERYLALDTTFFAKLVPKLDSVAYFREIKKLKAAAREANDEELELEAELLRLEYYMVGKQWNRAQFEAPMLALRDEADRQNIKQLQIRTRHKLGYFYFNIAHKYGAGFENYLDAYEILKEMPVSEMPNKQELVAEIGTAYYSFNDHKVARKFITLARKIDPSYKKRLPIDLTNTLGLIHQYSQPANLDSAEFYFLKARNMALKNSDSAWIGIVSGNLGSVYYQQNKFDKAKPLMEQDFRLSQISNEMDNAVNALNVLAKISLLEKDYAKARQQVELARRLAKQTGDPYHKLKLIFPIMAELHFAGGNPTLAYRYSDSGRAVLDSLFRRRNLRLQTNAEDKVEAERYQAAQMRLEHETNFRIIRNLAILLTCIIIILVINRQRLMLKQKQQKLQLEKQHMELELETAFRQLEDFTASIREKNKQIETYSEELKELKLLPDGPENLARQETLEKLMQATLLTDQQWEDFQLTFDKIHVGFLKRMRDKLPALTPADTRYIVLNKLNIPSKEMAAMLGVRPDAIRLYRHRLRKKYNLSDDKALEELVNMI